MFAVLQALTLVTGAFSADASRRNHGFCFSFLFYLFPLIFGYRNGWQNICLSNACLFSAGLEVCGGKSLIVLSRDCCWCLESKLVSVPRLVSHVPRICSSLSWRLTMRLFALSPAVYQFSLKPWYTSSVGAAVCIHSHLEKSRHSPTCLHTLVRHCSRFKLKMLEDSWRCIGEFVCAPKETSESLAYLPLAVSHGLFPRIQSLGLHLGSLVILWWPDLSFVLRDLFLSVAGLNKDLFRNLSPKLTGAVCLVLTTSQNSKTMQWNQHFGRVSNLEAANTSLYRPTQSHAPSVQPAVQSPIRQWLLYITLSRKPQPLKTCLLHVVSFVLFSQGKGCLSFCSVRFWPRSARTLRGFVQAENPRRASVSATW